MTIEQEIESKKSELIYFKRNFRLYLISIFGLIVIAFIMRVLIINKIINIADYLIHVQFIFKVIPIVVTIWFSKKVGLSVLRAYLLGFSTIIPYAGLISICILTLESKKYISSLEQEI